MNPNDSLWECTECGERVVSVYANQIQCPNCESSTFELADSREE